MQSIELKINGESVGEIAIYNRGPVDADRFRQNVWRYEWIVTHDSAIHGMLEQRQGFIDHARHDGPFVLAGAVIQAAVTRPRLATVVGKGTQSDPLRFVDSDDPLPPAPWHG